MHVIYRSECVSVLQCLKTLYLCGCQEGKHKEDRSKCNHIWSSFTLQQRVDRCREVEHEEAQQILCRHQP